MWGEIGVLLDEAGDQGHVWKNLFEQEDNREKILMLLGKRVSSISGLRYSRVVYTFSFPWFGAGRFLK